MKLKQTPLNKLFYILLIAGVLIGFLLVTNPSNVPLPVIVFPFLLIGMLFYQLALLVFTHGKVTPGRYLRRILSLSIAFMGVCLLVLESLHQLTWKDSLLTLVFTVFFWLYIWRADFLK
jgi:hypothetical protein